MNLAAAQKSLFTNNTTGQPGRLNGAQSPLSYDSEDMSMGTHTPGDSTPLRFPNNGTDDMPRQDTNGGLDSLSSLAKEFEQRKQVFDDDAQAIVEVKSGNLPSVNPMDEFRRLRRRFEAWKKDYKARLKEERAKVQRLAQTEGEKHRRRWWGKRK